MEFDADHRDQHITKIVYATFSAWSWHASLKTYKNMSEFYNSNVIKIHNDRLISKCLYPQRNERRRKQS
jgi:hypothetical protein